MMTANHSKSRRFLLEPWDEVDDETCVPLVGPPSMEGCLTNGGYSSGARPASGEGGAEWACWTELKVEVISKTGELVSIEAVGRRRAEAPSEEASVIASKDASSTSKSRD